MGSVQYALVVGVYADAHEAASDLRDITDPAEFGDAVGGAGILRRDWQGSALSQGSGGTLAYGIGTGAAAGIVAGVVLGGPLIGAVVGGALGGLVGRRMGRREIEGLVEAVADTVPVGGTALVAVVVEEQLPMVRAAMIRSLRSSGRVLDEGPLTAYARSLVRGNPTVMEALDAQQGNRDRQ